MRPVIILAVYAGWVLISFFVLSRMAEDIRDKRPRLMDRRWKRALWLLSCLFLVPLLLIPLEVISAVREFLSGGKDNG